MTSSPAAPHSTPAGFPYRSRPIAFAYGPGVDARRCAQIMHEESTRRGFGGPSLPTEEAARLLPLERFPDMVVITPSEGLDGDVTTLLRPSDDLAGGYKAGWPNGFAAWRAGRAELYDTGVLQLVVVAEILTHPAARPLLDKACIHHELMEASNDPDSIFRIYEVEIPGLSSVAPTLLAGREMLQLWEQIREWGLTDIGQVNVLFKKMNDLRLHYRKHARPGLQRPLGNTVPRSRYDFILDEPHEPDRPGLFPTWAQDGAEVVRDVITKLQADFPTLANPRPTRGATKRFGQFYDDVKCLRLHLMLNPGAEMVQFPHE